MRLLALGGFTVLALVMISAFQVTKTQSGLAVVGANAFAADLAPAHLPPPPPPVGKGKAPVGKGKAPIYTK
jgi:hypothetical protein